ncbi:hypothetical protein MMC13_001598, partial [Lambiella insularis]|nr:hypothetical protein [Lambiella insularis]
ILYVRPQAHRGLEDVPNTRKSWAYIGSANCSESAWGKLVQDRSKKRPKLNCRNWECGVIIPVHDSGSSGTTLDTAVERGMGTFAGTVPVPIQYPGEEYGESQPWFYSK